jgi:hypothetical protein
VLDPTPNRPSPEGIAELRQATIVGAEAGDGEGDPQRDELAAVAASARPTGEQIRDVRALNDTKMDGASYSDGDRPIRKE